MTRIALARLLQLSSQALPIGGYSHSQGLESAVERRIVHDEASLRGWIGDVFEYCMQSFELPSLACMAAAWVATDGALAASLNLDFLATRESAELRAATVQMGYSLRALLDVLPDMPATLLGALHSMQEPSLPCVWSGVASAWHIAPAETIMGYSWTWAENQVLAAMKAMPLGQSAGQRVLLGLGARIAASADAIAAAAVMPPQAYSNFAPGLAILSAQHESQYSRLFRS